MRPDNRATAVAWAAVLSLAWVAWCSIPSSSPFVKGWPWTPFGGRSNYWVETGDVYVRSLRTGETIHRPPGFRDQVEDDIWANGETDAGGRWVQNNRTGERMRLRAGDKPPKTSVTVKWITQLNRDEQQSARVVRLIICFGGVVVLSLVGFWAGAFVPGHHRSRRRRRRRSAGRPIVRI